MSQPGSTAGDAGDFDAIAMQLANAAATTPKGGVAETALGGKPGPAAGGCVRKATRGPRLRVARGVPDVLCLRWC